MKLKTSRAVFAVVAAAFVGFCAWRVAYLPYRIERVRAVVPPQAIFVSEHAELAARWPAMAMHPLVQGVAQGFGVTPADWEKKATDPGTCAILDRLAAREVLTAYVPGYGADGAPAWIVASWVGFQGQLLRWGVYKPLLKDFESCTFEGGRRGWRYRDQDGVLGGRTLSLTVTEGVLLGCLTADPNGVRGLLRRLERGAVGPAPLAELPFPGERGEQDRMLYGDLSERPAWQSTVGVWACLFALGAEGQLTARLRGPSAHLPPLGAASGGASVATLARTLRDTPGLLVVGPAELLAALEQVEEIAPTVRLLWERLQGLTPAGGRMFASVTQPEYNGRILGFSVATAMMGLELADEAGADAAIGGTLDAFNAAFGTTLIRRDVHADAPGVHTIESVRRGPLSPLADGERPSYVVTNGWLVVSSSGDALVRMLAGAGGDMPVWARELATEPGGALAWIDLRAAADALTKVMAMQDLLALAQGKGRPSTPERRWMALAQVWLGKMHALERARIWAQSRDGVDEIQIQLGPRVARAAGD